MEVFTVFCALILVLLAGLLRWLRQGKIQGIPEPAGNYAFGHLFQLGGNFCEKFLEWKTIVGPVFQLRIINLRVVVFNDKESIAKVCAMPESTGRPLHGFFQIIAATVGNGVANSEGPIWAEQRQFLVRSLRFFGVGRRETEENLQEEMEGILRDWEKLDGAPFKLSGCNTDYVFNALWKVFAGTRMPHSAISQFEANLEKITTMEKVGDKLVYVSTKLAATFTNAVQEKIQAAQAIAAVARQAVTEHQKLWIPKEPRDVIDRILDVVATTDDENSAFHKKNLKHGFAISDIISAAMDTSSRTLEWLMFYLAQSPAVELKLHAEIDRVLGLDMDYCRPSLSHRDRMPYAEACVLETLRLSSVAPFGIPHRALEDMDFNGATIPKGTILIMNSYGAHHDPQVWGDRPDEFKPERFLTTTAEGDKVDVNVKNNIVAFAAGRRMCPGSTMALDTMFLFVVNAYRKFHFELEEDYAGSWEGRFGIIRQAPEGVRVRAVLRSNLSSD